MTRPWALMTFVSVVIISSGCGYHLANHANALPATVHTIAIPAFKNGTVQYKIGDKITAALTRELIQRTRYQVITDQNEADAILTGGLVNFVSYPSTYDPITGRASAVQVIVQVQVTLRERASGKVLFTRPNLEVRDRFEVSVDPKTYFDESGGALDRVSRDIAQTIVSGILENF